MYNHETKLWHRLVAFLLSFVMVLGMLPANVVFAEELPEQEVTETVAPGTVEAVPAVGTVDGSTVTFSGVTLETADAESGWQIGAKVTAPEGAALESAVITGDEYATEGDAVLLTAVLTKDAAISGEPLTSSWDIDWNGDGFFDQTVVVTADPAALVLTENGNEVFPAPYGVGTVTGMLENAEGILETFATEDGVANFSGKTLDWKPIDEEKDRTQEGWWIGVRVDAPAGMDQEALKQAQCGPKNGAKNSFWSQMDTEGGSYLTFWCLVNQDYLENYNPLSYTWVFDWNGDGHFEQTVKAMVDPANITLVQNGKKVYPTVTVTAEVTGNGTVTVNGTLLANGQEVDVPKDEVVSVVATPNDDATRIGSMTIDGVAFEGSTYTFTDDAVIKVSFVTEYIVTFETTAGVFTDETGATTLTSLTVLPNGEVKFKFSHTYDNTYTAVVKDGDTVLTPDAEGVYTISNINENHSITAVVNDTTAPTISNVNVSNADAWMQSKTITFSVSDNEGAENVTTYVSATEYKDVNVLRNNEQAATSYEVTDHIKNGSTKTYYVYAVDKAGNMAVAPVEVKMVDTEAPEIKNLERVEDNVFSKDKYTFTVNEPDSGIAKVTVTHTNVLGQVIVEELKPNEKGEYTFEASEITEYAITVVDNAGNSSSSNQFADGIDTANPTVTLPEDICSNNKDLVITAEYSDEQAVGKPSGLKYLYYTTTESTNENRDPQATRKEISGNAGSYDIKLPNEDFEATYYVWVEDAAGKLSEVVSVHVIKDTTRPVVNSTKFTDAPDNVKQEGKYHVLKYANQVGVSVDAQDNLSGIVKYEYALMRTNDRYDQLNWITVDSKDFIATGEHLVNHTGRVLVRVTDKAGNESVYSQGKNCVAYYMLKTHKGEYEAVYITFSGEEAKKPTVDVTVTYTDGTTEYDGKWTQQDLIIHLDSMLTHGVAYYEYSIDGGQNWVSLPAINSTSALTNSYTFTITENTNANYIFRAVSTQTDDAGNAYVGSATEAKPVKVRKTAPDMAELIINGKRHQDNEWYYSVPTITITAPASAYPEDLDITTEYAVYAPGTADEDKQFHVFSEESRKAGETKSASLNVLELLKAAGGLENGDGYYVIEVRTKDEAGLETSSFYNVTKTVTKDEEGNETIEVNKEEMSSLAFNVDTTAPDVEQMTITYTYEKLVVDETGKPVMEEKKVNGEPVLDENGEPVMVQKKEIVTDNLKDTDNETFFDKWYNSSIKIELSANLDVSGEGSLQYLIVPNYGAYNSSADNNWLSYNSETGVVIDPNEKFVLIFRAEDAAGNVSEVHSTGIVVDDEAPSADETKNPDVEDTAVIFTIPEADGENDFYVNENGYEIQINVFDPTIKENLLGGDENNASGLKSITYTLETVEETDLAQTGKIEIQREDEDENAKPSLIFSQSGTIFVDAKHFDGYTVVLKVVATDNAGNSKTFTSDPMKIDITNPKINISYDNNNVANGTYYNAQRIATITVIERNFYKEVAGDLVDLTVQIQQGNTYVDYSIPAKWFTDNGLSGKWEKGDDADEWILKVPFVDDNDYTFAISMKDLAGHANDPITFGEDGSSTEQDINAFAFTVDKTAPVINVSYDLNNPTNGKYFNAVRTATVEVIEHNFNADKQNGTSIILTAFLDGKAIELPAWEFANIGGDTWRATVVFEDDGDYTFDAAATDMAGNTNGNVVNYGNAAVPTAFTIDKTIVQPEVGGVEDGGSYSDEAKPSVDIYDVNYDGYTLTLVRINQDGEQVVTEEFFDLIEFVAPGGTLRTEDIPHIKENDGIYILTVTITDKAGNTSDPRVTTFTVNRFGSIYLPEESLQKVTDGYNYQIEQDLVMTEINPNLLKDGSVKVQITRDGKPVDAAGVVITPKNPNAEHGWYEYTYTLSKDLFTQDGVYKITFLSEDSEGHENQSNPITFRVDTTVPELSSVVGLEEPIVNAQEHEVRFTVFDAIGLESISIYINDMEVPAQVISKFDDPNNFTGSFKLFESNDAQSVRIVIRDLAGNELDTGAEDFTSAYEFNDRITVSTNWFVRWFANKPLFFGSLAGIGGAGWLLWFLIFGKRKKEEEEEQAV